MSEQCVEGVRKKAKYLLEAEDREYLYRDGRLKSEPTGESSRLEPSSSHSGSPASLHHEPPMAPPLTTSLSQTSLSGLRGESSGIDLVPPMGHLADFAMQHDQMAGVGAGVGVGVGNIDIPGMDVWLAPAPAVDAQGAVREASPTLGGFGESGQGRDGEWGMFGGKDSFGGES